MSTPLIILAGILAIFAFILIPLMLYKGNNQQNKDAHAHGNQGKKQQHKKKKRH